MKFGLCVLPMLLTCFSSCTWEEIEEMEKNAEENRAAQEERRKKYHKILVSAAEYSMEPGVRSALFAKGFQPVSQWDDYGAVLSLEILSLNEGGGLPPYASYTGPAPETRKSGYKAQVRATVTDVNGRKLWTRTGESDAKGSASRQDALNSASTKALNTLPQYRYISW